MKTNSKHLAATEIMERRAKQEQEWAAMLADPVKRLGLLLAAQSIINRMWDADSARFQRLHGED
jgi:hypothetical protein